MSTHRHLAGLTVALALAACGGGGYSGGGGGNPTGPGTTGGGSPPSTSNAITVSDNRFTPGATTVPANSTITWTWNGRADHNVTFDDGEHSASQSTGTFQRAFATPGTYAYHCTIHGPSMSGTVTVQ